MPIGLWKHTRNNMLCRRS